MNKNAYTHIDHIREGGGTNKDLVWIRQNYAISWYDFFLFNDGVKRILIFELRHIYALTYIKHGNVFQLIQNGRLGWRGIWIGR